MARDELRVSQSGVETWGWLVSWCNPNHGTEARAWRGLVPRGAGAHPALHHPWGDALTPQPFIQALGLLTLPRAPLVPHLLLPLEHQNCF